MSDIKRKHIRFNAEANTFVAVKIGENKPIGGLAITESHGGCSAVFLSNDSFSESGICYLKVGEIDPLRAEIRWIMKVDKDLVKVGFQYLE